MDRCLRWNAVVGLPADPTLTAIFSAGLAWKDTHDRRTIWMDMDGQNVWIKWME